MPVAVLDDTDAETVLVVKVPDGREDIMEDEPALLYEAGAQETVDSREAPARAKEITEYIMKCFGVTVY